jgi:ArsR family transcriptional regulator, arsenate/arsenite/antimonite-responsive transcriptional repressor
MKSTPVADQHHTTGCVGPDSDGPCCAPVGSPALSRERIDELVTDLELLSHPIRLQLLAQLAAGDQPVCVCDLETLVPVKQPTVSHHLRLLREAGLVEAEKRGLWAYYHVRRDALSRLQRRVAAGLDGLAGGWHE